MEQEYTSATVSQAGQQEQKVKIPVGVKIISWLVILGAVGSLGATAYLFLVFKYPAAGVVALINGFVLLSLAIGIRRLRRWALYICSGLLSLVVIAGIYSFAFSPPLESGDIVKVVGAALIIAYLWSVRKKFS